MRYFILLFVGLSFFFACGERNYTALNEITEEEVIITDTPTYYSQTDQDRYYLFESGSETYGFATAIANGRPWRASAAYYPQIQTNDTLILLELRTYDPIGFFYREVIGITPIIRYKAKSYNTEDLGEIHHITDYLHNTAYCGMLIVDNGGDQTGAVYGLDSTEPAQVEVSHWDRETGLIKGYFRLPFYLQEEVNLFGMPSRILYDKGYFECYEKR